MSESEDKDRTAEPTNQDTPVTVAAPESSRRPLALVIAWALAPAIMMSLAGVCMELKMDDALPSLLLFFGAVGGIPAMLAWSIWMVYPANWTTAAKVVAVIPIALALCVANLFLAFGACAIIDPPFHIQ